MTFNLFGGFKFASAFKAPAPGCSPATGPNGNLFGNLADIKSQLLGHVANDLGHAAGGLANAGHGFLDKLLHHGDKDGNHGHNDNHHNTGGHNTDHGNHGGHDNHGGHGGHGGNSCDPDHSGGGTPATGNNFPPIPGDTLGVTFSIDLNGDGVNDEYAVVKAPDNPTAQDQTLQHYYDQVAADLSTSHPDVAANQIVVKATIYSASQGESYYHFNGDETTTEEQDADNDQDHHDDPDYDHNHEHGHGHGHGSDHHGSNDHGSDDHGSNCGSDGHGSNDHGSDKDDSHDHGSDDKDASCGSAKGDHDSNFYSHLMSWTSGSHDDKEPAPDHEDDCQNEDHGHEIHFL